MTNSIAEAVLKRDRAFLLFGLAALTLLSRCYLAAAPMPHAMHLHAWKARDFAVIFAMWTVMMVAMMAPSASPMVLTVGAMNRRRRNGGKPYDSATVFFGGYLAIWTAFSALAAAGRCSSLVGARSKGVSAPMHTTPRNLGSGICAIMRPMHTTSRRMALRAMTLGLAGGVTTSSGRAESLHEGRPAIVLATPEAKVVVDLGGGSIVDFRIPKHGLNPLRWLGPGHEKLALRPMAHFLCLDRWGQPSGAEQKNGMPFHGEATSVRWKEAAPPSSQQGYVSSEMSASLPLAGLDVRRTIRVSANAALFTVSETVTNRNKLGRAYNMVQHPTIGPPFLDSTVLVDSNAGKGFMQSSPLPDPEEPAIWWPLALDKGVPVDLRRLGSEAAPAVTSFVIDGDYGWVTAVNPSQRLLLGYLWKVADYPWLNIWRHVMNDKPLARGLEFGTTGLHQPFGILLAKGSIFGRRLFSYLDAGQSASRSYAAFLLDTPPGFSGVRSLVYKDGRIVLREQAPNPRELMLDAGSLF